IEHIIGPSGYPVITVGITACAVTGKIIARISAVISFNTALMVTINRANLTGPSRFNAQITFTRSFNFVAFGIHQYWLHAKKWHGGGASFQVDCTRQWREHVCPGFGLPPGIHNRAATIAHHAVIPLPGFGVNGLTDTAK